MIDALGNERRRRKVRGSHHKDTLRSDATLFVDQRVKRDLLEPDAIGRVVAHVPTAAVATPERDVPAPEQKANRSIVSVGNHPRVGRKSLRYQFR